MHVHSQNAMGCEHAIKHSFMHGEGLLTALHKAHCEREGGGHTANESFGTDYSLDDGEGFSEARPRAPHYLDSGRGCCIPIVRTLMGCGACNRIILYYMSRHGFVPHHVITTMHLLDSTVC